VDLSGRGKNPLQPEKKDVLLAIGRLWPRERNVPFPARETLQLSPPQQRREKKKSSAPAWV